MSEIAHPQSTSDFDPEVEMAASMLKAALAGVAPEKRAAVAARLTEMIAPPKAPKRGGPVLDNVIDLLKREKRVEWSASDVVTALKNKGVYADAKQIYGALTYLKGAKILRRVSYGKYLLEGGGLLITHDKEGP